MLHESHKVIKICKYKIKIVTILQTMSSEQVEEVPKLSNCPPVKPKCPNCNSNENVIKIIYGFPSSGLHSVLK